MNLNSFKSEIRKFNSFNERNSPFYGGTLSPLYFKRENKIGDVVLDRKGNKYSINDEGFFTKNEQELKKIVMKKLEKEEISKTNLVDYYSEDLFITKDLEGYTLHINSENILISDVDEPATYLYKHNAQYCAIVGNKAYYKNNTSETIIREIYDIDYLDITPTSFDGLCICYVESINTIVFQSKQFFLYVKDGALHILNKQSSWNYLFLSQDGALVAFAYSAPKDGVVKVYIYGGNATINSGTLSLSSTYLENKLGTGVGYDYIVDDNFEGFTTYCNYSSFSPYFTIHCKESKANKINDVYTMHYIADAYLTNGNFGLMRYLSMDDSLNAQYPFGYYAISGKWRVLIEKGIIRNISYAEDENYRGTIIAGWDSINTDKNVYITEDEEIIYCDYNSGKWFKTKVVEEKPSIKLIGDRHIIINTTDYYNSYDLNTEEFNHIADDWNNRVSPEWLVGTSDGIAHITYDITQTNYAVRQSSIGIWDYTITISTDVVIPSFISIGNCWLIPGQLTVSTDGKTTSNTSIDRKTVNFEIKIDYITKEKATVIFDTVNEQKVNGTIELVATIGDKDIRTESANDFSTLISGMDIKTIASAVNPMYTLTNSPYCSSIFSPVNVYLPKIVSQTTDVVSGNKPAIKYGYYGNQMIDVYIDSKYVWSVYNKPYTKNLNETTKYTTLDSNCKLRDVIEGTTYPIDTTNDIYYNFPIFFEYISTTTNQDLISIDGTPYSMAYYNNQLILLFRNNSSSSFYGITNAFVIQGTNYAIANNKLITYSFDESGYLSNEKICLSVDGLQFIAATPYEAYFWSDTNRSLYIYQNDRTLSLGLQADSISYVSTASTYNPATGSIIIPTDTGLIIQGSTGTFRLKNLIPDDELEATDNSKIYFLDTGIAYVSKNYIYYISYNKLDGYERLPIKLETMFYGDGNNILSVKDTLYIRLFDTEMKDRYIKVSIITLTNEGKQVETKEYKIKSSDWDKITNSYYIRYQPKFQRSVGTSYSIDTDCRISYLGIGNTVDTIQVSKANF